jgi:hypothetical protein
MRRLIWIVGVLAALCALPASASAYLPPGFIGISPQNPLGHKDFELMDEAGVDSVRLPLYWRAVEGESTLVVEPDWSGFDKEVELAAEAGVRVMPFVWGSPEWVAAEESALPVKTSWQRWAWQKFLREAVLRYGPNGEFWEDHTKLTFLPITHWEIWNEENIVAQVNEANPDEYAKLIRISGRTIHAADPESQVLIGGLFGRPLQIPPNIASGDFLARLYRIGKVKPYFDGVALHPYVAEAKAMGSQLNNFRRIMRAHGDARTPIYVTELGWGSRSGPSRWERGPEGQADQLSEAFELLSDNRSRWKVRGVWWFTWTDEGGTCQFCGSAGLLTSHYEAKPSWYRFVEWTGGEPDAVPEAVDPE